MTFLTGDRPTYFKQKERAKYDAWVTASGMLIVKVAKRISLSLFFKVTFWLLQNVPHAEVKCRGMSFDDAVDKCPLHVTNGDSLGFIVRPR